MISLFAEEPKKERSAICVISAFEATGRRGLLRDSDVITKRGYFPMAATSAIDVFKKEDQFSRYELSSHVLSESLIGIFSMQPLAIKVGSLVSEEQVEVIHEICKNCEIPLVLDLSFKSKSGEERTPKRTVDLALKLLIKDTTLLILNHQEAQALTKKSVFEARSMCEAAKAVYQTFGVHTLITGGHLDRIIRDIYCEGSACTEFGADQIKGKFFGAGDTFSSLVTTRLAESASIGDAIANAREDQTMAISNAHKIGDSSIVTLP